MASASTERAALFLRCLRFSLRPMKPISIHFLRSSPLHWAQLQNNFWRVAHPSYVASCHPVNRGVYTTRFSGCPTLPKTRVGVRTSSAPSSDHVHNRLGNACGTPAPNEVDTDRPSFPKPCPLIPKLFFKGRPPFPRKGWGTRPCSGRLCAGHRFLRKQLRFPRCQPRGMMRPQCGLLFV